MLQITSAGPLKNVRSCTVNTLQLRKSARLYNKHFTNAKAALSSPVVQTALIGTLVFQGTVQRGLGTLLGRLNCQFGETVVQPRGPREHGLVNVSTEFSVDDAGIDRVHCHSGTCKRGGGVGGSRYRFKKQK